MKKILIIIAFIVSIIMFICIIIGFVFWFAFGGGMFLIPNPPKPEITYGEFPISVTYELNGEIKKIEDVVVCEFDGFEILGEAGKYRKWKSYLKSGNKRLVLFRGEDDGIEYEISISYGIPDYYMGDLSYSIESYEKSMSENKYLGYIQWENGVQTGYSMPKQEVWDKYKLKVLDIQYGQPIENSFK